MIHTKALPACQVCPGAPYLILRKDLELPGVRSAPPKLVGRWLRAHLMASRCDYS
jgi:hypothetical protein